MEEWVGEPPWLLNFNGFGDGGREDPSGEGSRGGQVGEEGAAEDGDSKRSRGRGDHSRRRGELWVGVS